MTGLFGGAVPGAGNAISVAQDMAQGRSTVLALQSDSTGATLAWSGSRGASTTGTWPGLVVAALAQRYQGHRIEWQDWSDATQDYAITQVLEAASGERGIQCSASGGLRQCSVADYGHWATNLDVRVKASNNVWPPVSPGILVSQWGSAAPNLGWKLTVRNNGGPATQLVFDYTLDGTNILTAVSSGISPGTLSAGDVWFRVTYTADNGASGRNIQFFRSSDGVNWTSINTVITAGASQLAKVAVNYEIGSSGVASGPFSGIIYKTEIRDGIAGPIILPVSAEFWRAYNWTDQSALVGSPTLYVYCGAASGQAIAYFGNATRLPRMLPPITRGQVILSSGHNESAQVTTEKSVSDWFAAVKARIRYAPISAIMQNPNLPPSTRVSHHGEFVPLLGAIARSANLQPVDVFRAFQLAGPSTLINAADGIHPNQAGYRVWADTVLRDAIGA